MKILVTGSSGLIGAELVRSLSIKGHDVFQCQRLPDGSFDMRAIPDDVEAVVHLAGESIVGRWTDGKKRRIHESRVLGTRRLCEALTKRAHPPRLLASASAVGYYGDRGAEWLDETSAAGVGFLPAVCREWEAATQMASSAGIRVANLRFGIVLSRQGGALHRMLLPFQLGLGGIVGNGRQYWSWVAIDDVVGIIEHVVATSDIQGPVNVVCPQPVTNREFTKVLGHVLRRPTVVPMPSFAARIAFGEMAEALLLCSSRVKPSRLATSRYRFSFTDLETTLCHLVLDMEA
jgi:uncharacterized protein